MHSIVAFSESQDAAGAEVEVAAVPDQQVRTEGDDLTVPTFNNLFGALACIGTTGTRAKLASPSLRRVNNYEIQPCVLALFASGSAYYGMHPQQPIPLDINESLNALLTADPASAEQQTIVAFLAPGVINPTQGRTYHVRFTATLALVAGQWAFATISLSDELPTGNYSVVGADFVAATAVAFRFVPQGLALRPGAPVRQAISNPMDMTFRNGGLGEWFRFNTVQLPGIEVLSSAAQSSATYSGIMDVVAAQ